MTERPYLGRALLGLFLLLIVASAAGYRSSLAHWRVRVWETDFTPRVQAAGRDAVLRWHEEVLRDDLFAEDLLGLPLLLAGLRMFMGPGNALWAWESTRQKRRPVLSAVLWVLAVGVFAASTRPVLDLPRMQVLRPGVGETAPYLALSVALLVMAAFFYVGRRCPSSPGARDKLFNPPR